MKPARSQMKEIAAALSGRGQTGLYQWLWDRYDELPPYRKYKVNLVKLTAALNDLGVRGRDEDKPLNAGMVRKTYERVRLDREAARMENKSLRPGTAASAPVLTPPRGATTQSTKEATNVQPGNSRPGTFKLDLAPKENDKERLFGKRVIRKDD